MKKSLLINMLILIAFSLNAVVPSSFTYESYVTGPHDQKIQKPCFAFAGIAGVEAMYNLYYGSIRDLSERALFNCTYQPVNTLGQIMSHLRDNGVIDEVHYPYPSDIPCPSSLQYFDRVYDPNYNCLGGQQVLNRHRVRISFVNVASSSTLEYKKMILKYGPIMICNGQHCVLIHGWNTNGWLAKDSGPCEGVGKSQSYSFSTPILEAYAITGVTEQVYNGSSWTNLTLTKKEFSLNYGGNPVITINKPCFNIGTFTLNGLSDIGGAVVESWSGNKTGITLTMSADKKSCTISGNAADVTLSIVIKRVNGLLEKLNFNIGYVGVPAFNIEKTQGYCAGSNYEITTKLAHYNAPGINYSYSYNIPPLQNNSYVIVSGANAYWVFKAPETVNFSATVTYTQPGCNTQSTKTSYVYSLPCGYYKSAKEEGDESLSTDENKPFLFPNPASNKITVNSIGEGINIIRIFDITGNIVYNSEFETFIIIDINDFAKGVYMVECFTKNSEISSKKEKLIVE